MLQARRVLLVALLAMALVLGTAVVYAITITVDGVKESAWDGVGSQTPGSATDNNEDDITDAYDIKEVRWTNDSTGGPAPYGYMYWLIETHDSFDTNVIVIEPTIFICLNVDNNTTTGINASGYCNNMSGIDRRIQVRPSLDTVTVQKPNASNSGWVSVPSPTGGMRSLAWLDDDEDGIADYPYIEVGVDLQSLNITDAATCINTMPAAVYYDNGITDPEDATPESGTINMGCGNPTAVTLQTFNASNNSVILPGLVAALLLLVVGFGALLYRRQAN